MAYEQRVGSTGYWAYDGLEIQAGIEAHRLAVACARRLAAPGSRVLDVGAGTGALSKQLMDAGYNVSCTSWDGRVRLPVEVYRIDLDVPFGIEEVGGRAFDLVCCLEVIEHVENPSALLRSCRAVLAPNGRLLLSTPNVESVAARLQWLLRGRPLMFQGNEIVRNRHISMMWGQGLEFLVRCAGFEISEKHLVGEPRLRSAVQRLVKRPLYRVMERALRGDTRGETRFYVLTAAADSRKTGPGDVY